MSESRNKATYILSVSLFCLAGAIVYFTVELTRITVQIPAILNSVEQTSEKIEPVVKEIGEIREQIPPIIEEVRQVREQIPPILEEVKLAREQVPPILEEVKQTREAIPPILEEVRKTREAIPPVLEEVKKTREAIPPMMEKGEKLIADAKQAGSKASEGAVTGFFTGIVKAPFKLIGGMGKSVFGALGLDVEGITEEDQKLVVETAVKVLKEAKLGDSSKWSNPDSGNNGAVTLKESKSIEGRDCRVIQNIVYIAGVEKINREITACLDENDEWQKYENSEND